MFFPEELLSCFLVISNVSQRLQKQQMFLWCVTCGVHTFYQQAGHTILNYDEQTKTAHPTQQHMQSVGGKRWPPDGKHYSY